MTGFLWGRKGFGCSIAGDTEGNEGRGSVVDDVVVDDDSSVIGALGSEEEMLVAAVICVGVGPWDIEGAAAGLANLAE